MVTRKKDKRDCPNCGTRMDWKVTIDCEGIELWQCPKCKNIQFLAVV